MAARALGGLAVPFGLAVALAGCQPVPGPLAEAPPAENLAARVRGGDWFGLGTRLLAANEPASAERAFMRALIEEPLDARALTGAGIAAARQGHMAAARGYLEKAVALEPDDPQVQNAFGMVLYALGDYADAQRAFRTAFITSSGRNADAAINLRLAEAAVAALGLEPTLDPAVVFAVTRAGEHEFRLEPLDPERRTRQEDAAEAAGLEVASIADAATPDPTGEPGAAAADEAAPDAEETPRSEPGPGDGPEAGAVILSATPLEDWRPDETARIATREPTAAEEDAHDDAPEAFASDPLDGDAEKGADALAAATRGDDGTGSPAPVASGDAPDPDTVAPSGTGTDGADAEIAQGPDPEDGGDGPATAEPKPEVVAETDAPDPATSGSDADTRAAEAVPAVTEPEPDATAGADAPDAATPEPDADTRSAAEAEPAVTEPVAGTFRLTEAEVAAALGAGDADGDAAEPGWRWAADDKATD